MDRKLINSWLPVAALLVGSTFATPAPAQMLLTNSNARTPIACAGYTGAGDVQSSWLIFYGSMSFSCATRGSKLANICTTIATVDVCQDAVSDATTGAMVLGTISGVTCNNSTQICNVKLWYDLSGHGLDTGAISTPANRAVIVTNCLNTTFPCFVGNSNTEYVAGGSISSTAQPWGFYGVSDRTVVDSSFQVIINDGNANGLSWDNDNFEVGCFGNSTIRATASNSAFHAFTCAGNAGSSSVWVDATQTTGTISATTLSGTPTIFGNGFGQHMTSEWVEGGIVGADPTANATTLNANAKTRYGF